VPLAHDAHKAVGEELAAPHLLRELAVDAHREVGALVAQEGRVVGRVGHEAEPHPRRLLAEDAVDHRAEHREHVVGRVDHEVPVELGRDEGALGLERAAGLRHHAVDRLLQRERARRREHPPPRADEDRVAEALADAREAVAHRGRREPDAPGRAGDAPLLQERVEGGQEREVRGFHRVQR